MARRWKRLASTPYIGNLLLQVIDPPSKRPDWRKGLAALVVSGLIFYLSGLKGARYPSLLFLIGSVILLTGVHRLYWFLRLRRMSAEAIAQQAQARTRKGEPPATVPDLAVRPGRWQPHRLRSPGSDELSLSYILLTASWCSVSWFMTLVVIRLWLRDELPFFVVLLMSTFSLVGLGLVGGLFRRLSTKLRIRPSVVEVSSHPLSVGREERLVIVQEGNLELEAFSAMLRCEERVIRARDHHTRTDTAVVWEQTLIEPQALEAKLGRAAHHEVVICIPEKAMPSFESEHNEVRWTVQVTAKTPRSTDFERHVVLWVGHDPRATQPAR